MQRSKIARLLYLAATVLLFLTELIIALFIRDTVIRPYVGDILIIPLLCCIIRIAFPFKPKALGIYVIAVGVTAELLQYFQLGSLLGIEGTALGIILGSTFDVKDIVCYAVGGLLFFGAETYIKAIGKKR